MIKFLLNCFKNYKASFAVVALCSVLTAVVNLMEPYLTAKFIDEILINRDAAIFYNFILLLTILNVAAIAANRLSTIVSSKMRVRINNQVLEEVMKHVCRLRGESLFGIDMIYLSKRLDQDAGDLIYFAITAVVDTCINFALLCMAFGLLWSIDIKWSGLFLIIAALHTLAYRGLRKVLFNRSTVMRESESNYFTALSDTLLYIYSIKLHSLFDEYLGKFRAEFEKVFEAITRQVKIQFWFTTSSLNANAIFKVLIFLIGGLDVLDERLTIGNFVALNGYYLFAMQGVAYFMNVGQGYQNALAAYTRITEIKNIPAEVNGSEVLKEIRSIEVAAVNYNFGSQTILKGFNQKFERGKIYCIVGKNGSGKSTLLNLICGMLRPMSGAIRYNGLPIDEIDMIDARRRLIAVVEQKDFLKNDQLSGGERRRVSIDKALSKVPDVLIMDEPDNNLDAVGIDELIGKIVDGRSERLTIIISHDERIITLADEIINLNSEGGFVS